MARERRSSDGVYAISVAAELSGMALSSLRLYERKGLLTPSRTDGGTRRYSEDDVERLGRIAGLVEAGLTVDGIRIVLELEDENARLKREIAGLRAAQRRSPAPQQ
ncbi:hypothetical protein GCM10012320_12820 [Sinomonas cellulolyticus]|jgi:DNA-binding transcriptional MerR regulator|uniref:MerR family transcriptional regulator n=1 Tax=Sinomonas cellulolyticus TaxID=2801916 RepID=A0ABS1JZR9_9MICC|nr:MULTISPECIES: MerR family transcriptional regulator [Sinomonas]MBL0704718.1 MerR family transcriptional regulator [Sinomonas cellulolyticus]GHG46658.1 hypothetical protein GCM10012320_12820 [Sinomonas sp. KCTC 49339]